MDRLALALLLTLTSLAASAAEMPKDVFIHALCDGKASSDVLSSLRDSIRASQKYQVVSTLDDEGRMGVVLTVYMNCVDRNNLVSIATGYGLAKCYSGKNCHLSVDGSSIKATLCDASAAAECGRSLFTSFDEYVKKPNSLIFKLN
jgi:hypothetical protein